VLDNPIRALLHGLKREIFDEDGLNVFAFQWFLFE
jgi:hypothetical protein